MENNILDITIFSDTHGYLPKVDKPFDLLLICGDICPAHDHYYAYQINWLQNIFTQWINTLPYKDENSKVVITWGNHDTVGERIAKEEIACFNITTDNRVIFLRNDLYEYKYYTESEEPKTLTIFGTPYCKIFGNWAFMVSEDTQRKKFNQIPDNCDILISHDAADINNLGLISMGSYAGENAGNTVLAEFVKEKKPKYYFCGHIHSGNHSFEEIDGTWMSNVSFVNEGYVPAHNILNITIDKETKNLVEVTHQDNLNLC